MTKHIGSGGKKGLVTLFDQKKILGQDYILSPVSFYYFCTEKGLVKTR